MNKKQRAEAALKKIKRNEQIIELYTGGTSVRIIAADLDISQATIFRVLTDNKITLKSNHFTTATIEYAIDLYNAPENTIKSILEQTGIRSEQTLY